MGRLPRRPGGTDGWQCCFAGRSGLTAVDAAHSADGVQALFGQQVGGFGRGDFLFASGFEDGGHLLVDALGLLAGAVGVVGVADFGGDVDDAAGVDKEVGGVDDAAAVQCGAVLRGG